MHFSDDGDEISSILHSLGPVLARPPTLVRAYCNRYRVMGAMGASMGASIMGAMGVMGASLYILFI